MALKQLAIIIDDFTSHSVARYDNVAFYDLSVSAISKDWDYYLNGNFSVDGYGDSDYIEFIDANVDPRFRFLDYESAAQWQSGRVKTALGEGSGIGLGRYPSFWKLYSELVAVRSSDDSRVAHGDWVLKAFQEQLDNPQDVEIILIDIDDIATQYDDIFRIIPSEYAPGGYSTQLEHIIREQMFWRNALAPITGEFFIPTTLSISIAGAPPDLFETLGLAYLAANDMAIVQSAPNVNQGYFDWGSVYPEVINVGAWNVNSRGQPLWSSSATLGTIDVMANGRIEEPDWGTGSSFGTSFATPRVAAEIVNLWAAVIRTLESRLASGSTTRDELKNSPAIDYNSLVNNLVDIISDDVYAQLGGVWLNQPFKILKDDVRETSDPVVVNQLTADIGRPVITDTALTRPNRAPTLTSLGTTLKSANEDSPVTLTFADLKTAGNEIDDTGVTGFVVKSVTSGTLLINGAEWNASTNNLIDDTRSAIWTPPLNANGTLDAFSVTARDASGLESGAPVMGRMRVDAVNDLPTFYSFGPSMQRIVEDATLSLSFADLIHHGDERDIDGSVVAFLVKPAQGTMVINGAPWHPTNNNTIVANSTVTWTPAPNLNGKLTAFTAQARDNDGGVSTSTVSALVDVTPVNDAPSLTSFGTSVKATREDTAVPISFAELITKGNEADPDGSVRTFVVKSVTNGQLSIGGRPWDAETNAVINASRSATWTPAPNTNGSLTAFSAVARDNFGLESDSPVPVTITVSPVADVFRFTDTSELGSPGNPIRLHGFKPALSTPNAAARDKIHLSAIDAIPGGADNAFQFKSPPKKAAMTGWAGALWVTSSGSDTLVNLSTDPDSAAEHQIRLVGVNPANISAPDFFL